MMSLNLWEHLEIQNLFCIRLMGVDLLFLILQREVCYRRFRCTITCFIISGVYLGISVPIQIQQCNPVTSFKKSLY